MVALIAAFTRRNKTVSTEKRIMLRRRPASSHTRLASYFARVADVRRSTRPRSHLGSFEVIALKAVGANVRVADITGQSLPDLRWWRDESVKAALDHSAQ